MQAVSISLCCLPPTHPPLPHPSARPSLTYPLTILTRPFCLQAVDVLLAAAASAAYQPQNGAALSNGHAAAGPGSHTARLQRAQRKLASGMDKLLDPSATVRGTG